MARRIVTAREQHEMLSPWFGHEGMRRITRPPSDHPDLGDPVPRGSVYYHNTDREFNPGDELIPAQESGHESRWKDAPGYLPSMVYVYDEHGDPDEYSSLGRHRYEVEPIGDIHRDPEQHYNRAFQGLGLHERDKPAGNANSYVVPRARVVRRVGMLSPWRTAEQIYHPKLKTWHTHEFDQPLNYTAAVRTASEFDPFKVTHRLRDEFHDWFGQQYQKDPTRYSDKQWGAGMSHWPVIEDFLKDKYPAAHRGLMTGREDASALLDYPEASGIMSRYDDETGSDIQPYSSEDHQKLGYDPAEVAAGMVLLHNQNRDGLSNGYLDEDKDRLVDIFNKRQQMQRQYEQRTGAVDGWNHPAEGEGFDTWRNRLWDGVMGGKTFHPNAPGSHYRAMSNDEYQAGLSEGAFRPLIGDHMYVTDDPDRLAGGAYGAKNGGHIVEFDPQPTHDIPSRTIGDRLMEKGVTHIPLDAVRRVWSWNGTDHMPEVHRG